MKSVYHGKNILSNDKIIAFYRFGAELRALCPAKQDFLEECKKRFGG